MILAGNGTGKLKVNDRDAHQFFTQADGSKVQLVCFVDLSSGRIWSLLCTPTLHNISRGTLT